MNNDNINDYLPSILNPRKIKKQFGDLSLTQNSVTSRCSLSLKKSKVKTNIETKQRKIHAIDKENIHKACNHLLQNSKSTVILPIEENENKHSLVFSFSDDLDIENNQLPCNNRIHDNTEEPSLDFSFVKDLVVDEDKWTNTKETNDIPCLNFVGVYKSSGKKDEEPNNSIISVSSKTELDAKSHKSSATIICDIYKEKPIYSISLGLINCEAVNVRTKNTNIKNILINKENCDISLHCDVVESSELSIDSNFDKIMNDSIVLSPTTRKRSVASVNIEIKKKKLTTEDSTENSRVLILNSNAIERFSHVIVQPPNYNLLKQTISNKNNLKNKLKFDSLLKNGEKSYRNNLKQQSIDSFVKKTDVLKLKISDVRTLIKTSVSNCDTTDLVPEDVLDMTKNSGVVDGIKVDRCIKGVHKTNWKDYELSPKSTKASFKKGNESPKIQDIFEPSKSKSPKRRLNSVGSYSPRQALDSVHFNVTPKPKSNKSPPTKNIPYFKIITGTNFAVDAFSYGDIANVKHYFLTHFHSDHYSGLRRNFNKFLYCTKITGDLCVSRLGVNPKFIQVLNVNETMKIDSVEVTPVDANHCPGAIMLVFNLPNGRSILHTGDFRASPTMESYPVFWNKDIHSIYLDTTYCNPRYDFPTQEESLEMALYLLRQKKMALEKVGKKFSSVLIVCGTYTIGKEKFFLGVARRVGCAVWACPEKDRVLQVVEGHSFSHASPHACQLHVVPMRDLTYEKLRSYLESLQGAFSEVVAFKPSGWENGKNTTLEKDMITIHGIPYSEHSSFSELIRFVNFLKPKQVVPTVDISGGIKAVQKYFPCPLVCKQDFHNQSKVTDYFSIQHRPQVSAVT